MTYFVRHASLLWVLIVFFCLFFVGTATQEGMQSRNFLSILSLPALVFLLIFQKNWNDYKSSKFLGGILGVIIFVLIFQLLPLGEPFISKADPRLNYISEAAILGFTPGRGISLDPLATLHGINLLILLLAVWLAFARLGEKRGPIAQAVIVVLTLSACCMGAAATLLQNEGHFLWVTYNKGALTGPFANGNHMATLLCIGLAYAVCGVIRNSNRHSESLHAKAFQLAHVLFGVGVLSCILMTGSRAGLAIAIAIIVLIAGLQKRSWRRTVSNGLFLGVLVFGIVLPVSYIGLAVMGITPEINNGVIGSVNYMERIEMWVTALPMLKDHLPFGVGIGAFEDTFPFYENDAILSRKFINELHSDILQIIIEGGLPLFGIYVWSIVYFSKTMRQHFQKDQLFVSYKTPAGLACLVVFAHSFVDYPARTWLIAAVFTVCLVVFLSNKVTYSSRLSKASDFKFKAVEL